jgi:hypothetical protein
MMRQAACKDIAGETVVPHLATPPLFNQEENFT